MILTIISHGQIRSRHRNRTLCDRALRRDPADFGGFAIGSDKHIVCSETAVRSISERDEEICGNCAIVSGCICRFVAIGIVVEAVCCLPGQRFCHTIDRDTIDRAGRIFVMSGSAVINFRDRIQINGDRFACNVTDCNEISRGE